MREGGWARSDGGSTTSAPASARPRADRPARRWGRPRRSPPPARGAAAAGAAAARRSAAAGGGGARRREPGGELPEVTAAYETGGGLDAAASNAGLVLHALPGDSHAHGPAGPGHRHPGWWDTTI